MRMCGNCDEIAVKCAHCNKPFKRLAWCVEMWSDEGNYQEHYCSKKCYADSVCHIQAELYEAD